MAPNFQFNSVLNYFEIYWSLTFGWNYTAAIFSSNGWLVNLIMWSRSMCYNSEEFIKSNRGTMKLTTVSILWSLPEVLFDNLTAIRLCFHEVTSSGRKGLIQTWKSYSPPKWQTQLYKLYCRCLVLGPEINWERSRLSMGNCTILSTLVPDNSWKTNLKQSSYVQVQRSNWDNNETIFLISL